jgi:hypothetical protein
MPSVLGFAFFFEILRKFLSPGQLSYVEAEAKGPEKLKKDPKNEEQTAMMRLVLCGVAAVPGLTTPSQASAGDSGFEHGCSWKRGTTYETSNDYVSRQNPCEVCITREVSSGQPCKAGVTHSRKPRVPARNVVPIFQWVEVHY